jgi:hypothetical protein
VNGFEGPDREDHFFKKSHSWIRFDLFNSSKGLQSRDMLTWKPNSRTQRVRLEPILSDRTIMQKKKLS